LTEDGENVVITTGDCSLTILPALGGKIASLRIGSIELLQGPLKPYGPRDRTMDFSAADASGWDECLPSVAACSVKTSTGEVAVPDHGDLWRIPWQVLEATEDSITMRARCFSLPLELIRSLILTESPLGWKIRMLYSLTNVGDIQVPWAWSAHPLFACAEGDRIVLPEDTNTLRLEASRGNRLGVRGDSVTWPLATLAGDAPNAAGMTDLSSAAAENAGIGEKLFAGPMRQGWYLLERASIGLRIKVSFDTAITPYLGLWICYGGWPEGEGLKQVCIAPEPATAPVDSLAETGDWSRWLDAGETVNWPMEVEIERIARNSVEGPTQ
jgi:galactose mutarotase-like enzyme